MVSQMLSTWVAPTAPSAPVEPRPSALQPDKHCLPPLRPFQTAAVEAISSSPARDVMLIARTGSGKSMVFIEALRRAKQTDNLAFAVMVCPLNSLLLDHQLAVSKYGHTYRLLAGDNVGDTEIDEAKRALKRGEVDFILTTHERLDNTSYGKGSKSGAVISIFSQHGNKHCALVVLDEIQQATEWKDFRPAINYVAQSIGIWAPLAPILLLTGSLPKGDVSLFVKVYFGRSKDPLIITISLDRPNVYFGILATNPSDPVDPVSYFDILYLRMRGVLRSGGTVLVYVPTRADTLRVRRRAEQVLTEQEGLPLETVKVQVLSVHSINSQKHKETILSKFKDGSARVVVATVCFGLGVDYPSVGFVGCLFVPETASLLLQMFGRAGRDQGVAEAWVVTKTNSLSKRSKVEKEYQEILTKCVGTLEQAAKDASVLLGPQQQHLCVRKDLFGSLLASPETVSADTFINKIAQVTVGDTGVDPERLPNPACCSVCSLFDLPSFRCQQVLIKKTNRPILLVT